MKKSKFNPYSELQIPKTAEIAEIKTAYKKLALVVYIFIREMAS